MTVDVLPGWYNSKMSWWVVPKDDAECSLWMLKSDDVVVDVDSEEVELLEDTPFSPAAFVNRFRCCFSEGSRKEFIHCGKGFRLRGRCDTEMKRRRCLS